MTPRVKKLYKSAIKNEKFLNAIKEADNDTKPGIFADNNDKVIFATMYYGWIVSEHGIAWELHL
jgi:hypothetical protein